MPSSEPKSLTSIVMSGIGGLFVSGVIYGGGLWLLLLLLRHSGQIDNIISYRNCVLISYIYVCVRAYDRQIFSSK